MSQSYQNPKQRYLQAKADLQKILDSTEFQNAQEIDRKAVIAYVAEDGEEFEKQVKLLEEAYGAIGYEEARREFLVAERALFQWAKSMLDYFLGLEPHYMLLFEQAEYDERARRELIGFILETLPDA